MKVYYWYEDYRNEHDAAEIGTANVEHSGDGPYVLYQDYDALAARLAEAERLLRSWSAWYSGQNGKPNQMPIKETGDLLMRAADNGTAPDAENAAPNLRTADSATACDNPIHVYRNIEGVCPDCGKL